MRINLLDQANLKEAWIVELDGKIIRTAIEADDEEGWVVIPDIKALAPLDEEKEDVDFDDPPPFEEAPVKKLYGEVKIRKFSPAKK